MPDQYIGGLGDKGAASLKKFAEQGGKVIFIGSLTSRMGLPYLSVYGITKGAVTQLTTTMNAVIVKLTALTRPGTRIVVTGYWSVFLDGTVGAQRGPTYVSVSNALTRVVNSALADAAHAHHDLYVDLYTPFKGKGSDDDTDLLAEDGDHPNSLGQQAIAAAITQSLHVCQRCRGQR